MLTTTCVNHHYNFRDASDEESQGHSWKEGGGLLYLVYSLTLGLSEVPSNAYRRVMMERFVQSGRGHT